MNEREHRLACEEYFHLQSSIGRYDQLTHGIKNWSITVGTGAIAAGFIQHMDSLFLVAAISSLIFWATEARWKRFQHLHIKRIVQLELILGNTNDLNDDAKTKYSGPKIRHNMSNSFKAYREKRIPSPLVILAEELSMMIKSNTRMPHLALILLSVSIWIALNLDKLCV